MFCTVSTTVLYSQCRFPRKGSLKLCLSWKNRKRGKTCTPTHRRIDFCPAAQSAAPDGTDGHAEENGAKPPSARVGVAIGMGADRQGKGRVYGGGRETTALVCKNYRATFPKPPRWFCESTALVFLSPPCVRPFCWYRAPVPFACPARFAGLLPASRHLRSACLAALRERQETRGESVGLALAKPPPNHLCAFVPLCLCVKNPVLNAVNPSPRLRFHA